MSAMRGRHRWARAANTTSASSPDRDIADELCAAVREQSYDAGSGRFDATVSIGGIFLGPGTPTHHDALLAADTALYEAKAAGGDRAILHEASPGA
jgi:GGDEF domain-containing protein